jgi:hypothetical protein
MMNLFLLILKLTVFLNKLGYLNAHGRLIVPPARSSAWREDNKRFPVYYDDNQMYCGGSFQLRNNGKIIFDVFFFLFFSFRAIQKVDVVFVVKISTV